MKKLMILCMLASASTFLFSGGTKEAKPEEGIKTIRFATWGVQEKGTQGYFETFKSKFEASNPTVKIEWISYPYTQIKQQVLVMGAAGQIPDLIQAERGWLAGMISSGYTSPLDNSLTPDYMKEVQPALKEDLSLDGKVWGAVWIYSPFLLYYNKDLFRQAGLDPSKPPKTYQEAFEYARKISKLKDKDGNNVYGLGITTGNVPVSGACLLSVLFSFGGGIWDASGAIRADTDPNREALEFLSTLNKEKLNPEGAKLKDHRNLFAINRLGMYLDQLWGLNGVKAINPAVIPSVGASGPLGSARSMGKSTLEAHILMLGKGSKVSKEAGRLVDFLTSKEMLREYLSVNPFLAARTSAAASLTEAEPLLAPLKDVASSIVSVMKHPNLEAAYLELTNAAQAVTVGKIMANEVVKTMDSKLKETLK